MDPKTLEKLEELCDLDAKLINQSFAISTSLGISAMQSSIASFEGFLFKQYGNFIPSMRIWNIVLMSVGILKRVDEKYTSESIMAVLFPNGIPQEVNQ